MRHLFGKIDLRRILAVASAATVASLALLSGCGGADAPSVVSLATKASTTTTAPPTTTTTAPTDQPTTLVPMSEINDDHYSDLSNEHRSWWYRIPDPLNEGIPASIDDDVKELIDKYGALWQAPAGKKKVYITMDEGYELEGNTPKLLEVAKEKNFKIHFFITGGYVEEQPDLVKQMVADGHIVCNHSMFHKNGPVVVDDEGVQGMVNEIVDANKKFHDLIGKDFAPFFRPPEGGYSERTLAIARDLGYHDVFWSFAYRDWIADEQLPDDEAIDKVMGQLHDGSILLLHANSKTNAEIMGRLVDKIRDAGYEIGTLYDVLDQIKSGDTGTAESAAADGSGEGTKAAEGSTVETTSEVAPGVTTAESTTAETTEGTKAEQGTVKTHTIVEGDTLWGIAEKYYPGEDVTTTVQKIAEANGSDDPDNMKLQIGQTIKLP